MADEIQHRQVEDKMCWEKSLSAKKPHRIEGGRILEELIRNLTQNIQLSVDGKYIENRDQNIFFFYIPFPAANNLLRFRERQIINNQDIPPPKKNSLTTTIRLNFSNMNWNCKHSLNIDCVVPECVKNISPWIPSRYWSEAFGFLLLLLLQTHIK